MREFIVKDYINTSEFASARASYLHATGKHLFRTRRLTRWDINMYRKVTGNYGVTTIEEFEEALENVKWLDSISLRVNGYKVVITQMEEALQRMRNEKA